MIAVPRANPRRTARHAFLHGVPSRDSLHDLPMKLTIVAGLLTISLHSALGANAVSDGPPLGEIMRDFHAFAEQQYAHLLKEIEGKPGYPRTYEDGRIRLVKSSDWTSGYFPGSLWFLYEATGNDKWREAAEHYTAGMEVEKNHTHTQDVGIMLTSSFGHGLRLTGNSHYRDVLLTGARSLSTRFNSTVGAIQAWPLWKPEWSFPVIIDGMINLDLLFWAAEAGDEPGYREIAIAHADTTLKNHFRADGSSVHLVDYDPTNGQVKRKQTFQGAADDSSWARGQAWAVYGYSLMYRETKNPVYLNHAKKVAAFIMNHPRMPADKVPYWDFDAPDIPNAPRDAAAAAVIASALAELRQFVDQDTAGLYSKFAEQQMRSLASPAYRSNLGGNGGFLLLHSTGHLPEGKEIDVPLNYADYYFLEALQRFKRTKR
jgi:rhamnogalacturonyl hydrolase YesR